MNRMPKALALAFVAALACPPAVSAAPASRPDSAAARASAAPLLGAWSLDTSRMAMPPGQRPKSVKFTFGDAGGGKWTVQVDIVYAPGNEVHSVCTAALDGTPAAIENSPEADTGAFKRPAPNVLVMALQKRGVLVSTRIYAVAPDGRGLVETAVYPGENGFPVMKTNYFTRVRQQDARRGPTGR
jgi:hypothetical protein